MLLTLQIKVKYFCKIFLIMGCRGNYFLNKYLNNIIKKCMLNFLTTYKVILFLSCLHYVIVIYLKLSKILFLVYATSEKFHIL